jgi:hypothetical protein
LKFATIPVDWESISKDAKSATNVILFPGDEIVVAPFNEGVKVTGNVLLTSEIPYRRFWILPWLWEVWIIRDGRKKLIIYPNGKAAVAHSFLFIRSYPSKSRISNCSSRKTRVKKLSSEVVSIAVLRVWLY